MGAAALAYRERALLPRLGETVPKGPVLLDANVFLNAFARRGPPALQTLIANLPMSFLSGPVVAEMAWVRGRLDASHPNTAGALAAYEDALGRISVEKVLIPDAGEWLAAGALAGAAARAIAGGATSMRGAVDRVELINDAVTAVVALRAGVSIVTADADFDLFQQLEPGLDVLFYN
jgi:predicted nucleic acid-binding protein